MANIQERRDKSGKLISYSIRVHRGRDADGRQLKPWTATFAVSPSWTEKSARKKAEAFAATFEKQCREGTTTDSRQKFAAYCDYVIGLKEQRGVKHSTIVRYKELTGRIYPAIGHIKLRDLRADHLNDLYSHLAEDGQSKRGGKLSAKTILEHHRLISTVLEQALREACTVQRGQPRHAAKGGAQGAQLLPAGTGGRHPGRPGARADEVENIGSPAAHHRRTARGSAGSQMGQSGLYGQPGLYLQFRAVCPGCWYLRRHTQDRAVKALYCPTRRDHAAAPVVSCMAGSGTAAAGGILPGQGLSLCPGQRKPHAPGQRDRLS